MKTEKVHSNMQQHLSLLNGVALKWGAGTSSSGHGTGGGLHAGTTRRSSHSPLSPFTNPSTDGSTRSAVICSAVCMFAGASSPRRPPTCPAQAVLLQPLHVLFMIAKHTINSPVTTPQTVFNEHGDAIAWIKPAGVPAQCSPRDLSLLLPGPWTAPPACIILGPGEYRTPLRK